MDLHIFKRSGSIKLKRSIVVRFTVGQILVASLVVLAAMAEVLFGVQHRWHDSFTTIVCCTGWLYSPLLLYIAVRRMSETGFSWLWFLSAFVSFAGIALWAFTIYFLVSRDLVL
jgi:uncharacterized membrane protein YhaH (DUF805 family)